ncbi:MAG: hypothetical protein ACJ764_06690 [Solirubrobacteraceae bacterium]
MTRGLLRKITVWTVLAGTVGLGLGGCFDVKAADLFLLQRTGQGPAFSLLVKDNGMISCNGGELRRLADPLLLQARDLATAYETYVRSGLKGGIPGNSVFRYRIELPYGTITFPDTAAAQRPVFAQTEQFALRAAHQACHLAT